MLEIDNGVHPLDSFPPSKLARQHWELEATDSKKQTVLGVKKSLLK